MQRINANLYFAIFSANPIDKNFTRQAAINQLDDVECIKGYYFPSTLKNGVGMVPIENKFFLHDPTKSPATDGFNSEMIEEAQFKKQTGVARIMKRYGDKLQINQTIEHAKQGLELNKLSKDEDFNSERYLDIFKHLIIEISLT